MSMSFQSAFPLFLLGLVIFSTIGIGNADVNILVGKGTHINVVEVSLPQLDIQRKDNCSETPLPSPSTVRIKSCSNNVKYPIFIACCTRTGTGT
jgi:hypothetical protein